MGRASTDPWKLLARRSDLSKLAAFFESFEEGITAAFADADRRVRVLRHEKPGVSARGNYRRWRLDEAFRSAANRAQMPVVTGKTSPPSWTFPIVRSGAFSITLGIVDKPLAKGRRRLRCRGHYMRQHAARNSAVDPQAELELKGQDVKALLPNGAVGAVVVVEGSTYQPDSPRYVGFWIPSADLKRPLFRVRLDRLIEWLRAEDATKAPRKPITAQRKQLIRKPVVRKLPRRKSGDEA